VVGVSAAQARDVDGRRDVGLVERADERPHRLQMTWTFSDDPSGTRQLIELAFSESEGSTTVVMVNSGIATDARRDAQDHGWRGCFDELEQALASS
jgi:uncharacterized protein YndB with AHSA1/START domain